MCCLFGMLDYGGNFTGRQRTAILSILATECEARGTDAAGIAYNSSGSLHVYKRPVPAHKLRVRIPNDAPVIMGHTRMTTQGSEKRNYNNHPFLGQARGQRFALTHNGVLHNDKVLRRSLKLPQTKIQTDSYAAVQLIEKKGTLDLASLKFMAEQVEGSFTFTVLDEGNNWYLVKGDNPMCLCHYPQSGLYLYASTAEILENALKKMRLGLEKPKRVEMECGDILQIAADGAVTRSRFDTSAFWWSWPPWRYMAYARCVDVPKNDYERKYLDEVKSVAASFGYSPESIDKILEQGFTLDDIEELLYCGQF